MCNILIVVIKTCCSISKKKRPSQNYRKQKKKRKKKGIYKINQSRKQSVNKFKPASPPVLLKSDMCSNVNIFKSRGFSFTDTFYWKDHAKGPHWQHPLKLGWKWFSQWLLDGSAHVIWFISHFLAPFFIIFFLYWSSMSIFEMQCLKRK